MGDSPDNATKDEQPRMIRPIFSAMPMACHGYSYGLLWDTHTIQGLYKHGSLPLLPLILSISEPYEFQSLECIKQPYVICWVLVFRCSLYVFIFFYRLRFYFFVFVVMFFACRRNAPKSVICV